MDDRSLWGQISLKLIDGDGQCIYGGSMNED